ncbi:MAG: 4,5-DOPA dioxygenase extradiol [Eubacteriales bacterium]|nr:4,5-DOPA dioxygenase extradiol [Eubacteriales bacterium]
MPVLFIGHGSPMNAIENNPFSAKWEQIAEHLPKPKAILAVSAHWFTPGTRVNDSPAPQMIYDMYGFPAELYRVAYPAPGAPETARLTRELIGGAARIDNSWGLDHGTWSVLRHVYPKADIPVFQLSVNRDATPAEHFALGSRLRALREQGVLIFASGNVVHNLAKVRWDMDGGFSWAEEFDRYIKQNIVNRDFDKVVRYKQAGESASMAFYTLDHFAPLLYALGATDEKDAVTVFSDVCVLGSLSMTSYLFEAPGGLDETTLPKEEQT